MARKGSVLCLSPCSFARNMSFKYDHVGNRIQSTPGRVGAVSNYVLERKLTYAGCIFI